MEATKARLVTRIIELTNAMSNEDREQAYAYIESAAVMNVDEPSNARWALNCLAADFVSELYFEIKKLGA